MMTTKRWLLPFVLPLALAGGCAEPDEDVVVDDGKEDDFFSASAIEYWVKGEGRVTIEESLKTATAAKKLARAKELVVLRQLANTWFLNQYIKEKDERANMNYGGWGGLTRFTLESETDVEPKPVDDLTYKFPFKVQVAGTKALIGRIPGTYEDGVKTFDLKMGKIDNETLAKVEVNHEWFQEKPYKAFNPDRLPAKDIETITLQMSKQKEATDAYFDYGSLFADGELTIGLHFGWDYHSRDDLSGSKEVYDFLIDEGFKSPTADYKSYEHKSGPLEKTIQSNGKDIRVKIWMSHPGSEERGIAGANGETDAGGRQLEDEMRESFSDREVIVFEGHSGPMYGFALANWKKTEEGDLDDSKIPTLKMPRDKYQIVVANGCDTYALGQAFWENPAKADHKNLNVITTTNFSASGEMASLKRFITALTNQRDGKVVAQKLSQLAAGMDRDQGYGFNTMYGVHGADHNPRFDPTGNKRKLCDECSDDSECGADGNRCTRISSSLKACTIGCTADSGCPSNYACRPIASSRTRTVSTYQCVPKTRSCN